MAGRSGKRILVVDDDKNNRTLCGDALAATGYEVDTASDGVYGLELLSLSAYDLVLTDINMPRLDGIGFYKSAVTRYPDLKDSFLFMTAGIYSRDTWGFIREIGRKCIYKPFKITDLISCLDNLLAKPPETALARDIEEKRREPRFESLTDCEVFDKGVVNMDILPATAREVSGNGLRIRYAGCPLRPGADVSVYARINQADMLRGARVMWSGEDASGCYVSGLHFRAPMPVASIAGICGPKKAWRAETGCGR